MEIWKKQQTLAVDGYYVNDRMICFSMSDGRTLSLSLSLFPDLKHVEQHVVRNCTLTENGLGLFWPELDLTIHFDDYLTS